HYTSYITSLLGHHRYAKVGMGAGACSGVFAPSLPPPQPRRDGVGAGRLRPSPCEQGEGRCVSGWQGKGPAYLDADISSTWRPCPQLADPFGAGYSGFAPHPACSRLRSRDDEPAVAGADTSEQDIGRVCKMTVDESLAFLKAHQPMPDDTELP